MDRNGNPEECLRSLVTVALFWRFDTDDDSISQLTSQPVLAPARPAAKSPHWDGDRRKKLATLKSFCALLFLCSFLVFTTLVSCASVVAAAVAAATCVSELSSGISLSATELVALAAPPSRVVGQRGRGQGERRECL